MTTYKTGNPIGSKDPRDLYDNAENLDTAVNDISRDTWTDRLGRSRKTMSGMERQFDADQAIREARFNMFLESSGYQFLGDYAAGIEITEYNQIVRDADGEFWRLSGQVELPYTTTGDWGGEEGMFVAVGDAALRQELANPDIGAAMLGRGVVAVDSIADLLALPEGQRREGLLYTVRGYYADSDSGGGQFYWNPAGEKSGADGGSIIDPHAGVGYDGTPATLLEFLSGQGSESGYGVYVRLGGNVDASHFGLVSGRGKVDVGAVVNHMLRSGIRDVVLPHGDFSLETQIRLPADCHLRGGGIARTRIFVEDSFGNSTGTDRACIITDNYTGLEHSNVLDNIHLSDFFIDGRAWDRAFGLPHSNIGSNILLAGVKNSSVRRVRTINGGMHCLDLCASAYQKWVEGSGAYTQPLGMSHDVLFEDVIAENPRGDDPITTHNSYRVQIIRCRAIYDRELHGAPFWTCNGIEIDEGCHDVHVLDCYSYGGMTGFQAKSHGNNTHPAYDVTFENCIAENVGYGFQIQGMNFATADSYPKNNFRSIKIINCKVKNIDTVVGYLNQVDRDNGLTPSGEIGYEHGARPVQASGYSDILVSGLVVADSPNAWMRIGNNIRKIVFENITVDTHLTINAESGFIHMVGGTDNVPILIVRGLYSNVAQPVRAVIVTPGEVSVTIDDIYWPKASGAIERSCIIYGNHNTDVHIGTVLAPGWDFAVSRPAGEIAGYGFGGEAPGEIGFSISPAGGYRLFQSGVNPSEVFGLPGDVIVISGDGMYVCISGTPGSPSNSWQKLN